LRPVGEIHHEDWFDEGDVRSQVPVPPSVLLRGEKEPQSSLADDPMTRLWQDAEERETGADAVEAIRARRRQAAETEEKSGFWHRKRHRDPHDPRESAQHT
jgi:hypothetical protein